MASIVRETTMHQVVVAANAIVTLLSLFPKFLQKIRDLIVYLYTNFKDLVTLVLMAVGVIVFLYAANHYVENHYHINARLSRFLETSTEIKEF